MSKILLRSAEILREQTQLRCLCCLPLDLFPRDRRRERLYNNLRPASDAAISFSRRFCLVSSFFALITHQVMSLR
jgi:hypothetical protein